LIETKYKGKGRAIRVLLKLFGNPDFLVKDFREKNFDADLDEEELEEMTARSHDGKNRRIVYKPGGGINKSRHDMPSEEGSISALSERRISPGRDDHNRMMYQPDDMNMAPFRLKKLNKWEQKAIKDIERIKMKKQIVLDKVFSIFLISSNN
jgi:hypothetical protein